MDYSTHTVYSNTLSSQWYPTDSISIPTIVDGKSIFLTSLLKRKHTKSSTSLFGINNTNTITVSFSSAVIDETVFSSSIDYQSFPRSSSSLEGSVFLYSEEFAYSSLDFISAPVPFEDSLLHITLAAPLTIKNTLPLPIALEIHTPPENLKYSNQSIEGKKNIQLKKNDINPLAILRSFEQTHNSRAVQELGVLPSLGIEGIKELAVVMVDENVNSDNTNNKETKNSFPILPSYVENFLGGYCYPLFRPYFSKLISPSIYIQTYLVFLYPGQKMSLYHLPYSHPLAVRVSFALTKKKEKKKILEPVIQRFTQKQRTSVDIQEIDGFLDDIFPVDELSESEEELIGESGKDLDKLELRKNNEPNVVKRVSPTFESEKTVVEYDYFLDIGNIWSNCYIIHENPDDIFRSHRISSKQLVYNPPSLRLLFIDDIAIHMRIAADDVTGENTPVNTNPVTRRTLQFYTPFWIINKTKLNLVYFEELVDIPKSTSSEAKQTKKQEYITETQARAVLPSERVRNLPWEINIWKETDSKIGLAPFSNVYPLPFSFYQIPVSSTNFSLRLSSEPEVYPNLSIRYAFPNQTNNSYLPISVASLLLSSDAQVLNIPDCML
jgi:hypothetical protein